MSKIGPVFLSVRAGSWKLIHSIVLIFIHLGVLQFLGSIQSAFLIGFSFR